MRRDSASSLLERESSTAWMPMDKDSFLLASWNAGLQTTAAIKLSVKICRLSRDLLIATMTTASQGRSS